jgi:hypothetical protein
MSDKLRGRAAVVSQIQVGDQSVNYTRISRLGDISQGGTASAAFGDVTTASLKIGSAGTDIRDLKFGSISPCFNEIAACATGTGSVAVTGMTVSHYVFVSPCSPTSPCCVLTSVCPASGCIFLGLYNEGDTAAVCSTCPWSYLAIR